MNFFVSFHIFFSFAGFFGWNLVSPMDKEAVLTVDELDAMAVHQGCNRKTALALPNGADPERIDKDVSCPKHKIFRNFCWKH